MWGTMNWTEEELLGFIINFKKPLFCIGPKVDEWMPPKVRFLASRAFRGLRWENYWQALYTAKELSSENPLTFTPTKKK